MTKFEEIEEACITRMAKGLNMLGIPVDTSNEVQYVACRQILEAVCSYSHMIELDSKLREYAGISDTVERTVD